MEVTRGRFLAGGAAWALGGRTALGAGATGGGLAAHTPSQATLWAWQKKQASYGAIFTGSPQHKAFLAWLTEEFGRLGLRMERKTFAFPYWEAQAWSLKAGDRELPVSGYVPYSGGTPAEGVTARLYDAGMFDPSYEKGPRRPPVDYGPANGRIVLSEVTRAVGFFDVVMSSAHTYPASEAYSFDQSGPNYTVHTPDLKAMGAAGAVGAIHVWRDIPAELAQGQVMPFDSPPSPIPGLWVSRQTGEALKRAAAEGTPVTLTLRATVTPETTTDTLWAVLPGQTDETIIVNTHNDGCNAFEENGPTCLLALAAAAVRTPLARRRRTLVFLMRGGHFGHGYVPGPADWQKEHPELMRHAIACLTVEHLGGMEGTEAGGRFAPAAKPAWAQAFCTTDAMEAIYLRSAAKTDLQRAVALRSRIGPLGEGSTFAAAGIPTVAYLGSTDWMFKAPKDGAIGRIDPARLHRCLDTLAVALEEIDATPAEGLRG